MIYPELYLNLSYEQKVWFSIIVIAVVLICIIVTRMKNKAIYIKEKKTVPPTINFDLYEFVMQDRKQEYIGQNKIYINELKRL